MERQSNGKTLDYIIDEMIGVVENSKEEIFHISTESQQDYNQLRMELADTKESVTKHINDGDKLDLKVKISRKKLSEVSKNFDLFTEEEIREVYDSTLKMQTDLAMLRREEGILRERRDDLERRLLTLNQTMVRAVGLGDKISVILSYLQDDFKQVNDMIEDAKQKQEFSLKIIQAQEEERKRISREIHDGPAQMLANILIRSDLVDRAYREGSVEHALVELKSVREMIRMSLHEVRHIIYDLRPMALDDLGLVPTIKKYLATTAEYHNAAIEFKSLGKEIRLKQEYEVAFFRLAQESVQNAIKHANASLIKVKLQIADKNVTMSIQDNGAGFDSEATYEKSFGLIGMKERVEMLSGELTINSDEKNGTRIFINIPYDGTEIEVN